MKTYSKKYDRKISYFIKLNETPIIYNVTILNRKPNTELFVNNYIELLENNIKINVVRNLQKNEFINKYCELTSINEICENNENISTSISNKIKTYDNINIYREFNEKYIVSSKNNFLNITCFNKKNDKNYKFIYVERNLFDEYRNIQIVRTLGLELSN